MEEEVREKILKGAEALFMKYGVRSISMDDIARHLSVSKKTLYQYFADKEDIVTMTCKAHMERSHCDYEALHQRSKNAVEELVNLSVLLRQDLEELNPSLLFDLQKYHPKAWKVWLDYKNKFIRDSVVRNLEQGIEEGYYRADIKTEILAVMRLQLMEMGFDDQVFPRDRYKLSEVQMELFDHFAHGLLTEKGRKLYAKLKEKILTPTGN